MLARLAELAYDVSAILTYPPGTNMHDNKLDARRNFLIFLAGSPLLASLPTAPGFCDALDLEDGGNTEHQGYQTVASGRPASLTRG